MTAKTQTFLLGMALLAAATTSSGSQEGFKRPSKPVMIEGGTGLDPCSNAYVKGLDPNGDGWLAVKAAPDIKSKRIDKIHNGQEVFVCAERGDWLGVVYIKGDFEPCGVTTDWRETAPYTGPCSSGWAHRKFIEIYAG
ncbi:integron [Tianweitania sediminis]|uniref:Integron n=1 Tax=Tianweitania sediminis TaxID=1502156 RepID=A0A8J7UGB2_9HYPH|nr:integron [Tianweitania sediminis]MBP0437989.1 integron [Tianweitania sediminis]